MKKRTETEWQKLTAEYQESGLKQTEWCKLKGINVHTFQNKLSKIRELEKTKSKKSSAATQTPKEASNARKLSNPINPSQQQTETETAPTKWLAVSGHKTVEAEDSTMNVKINGFEICINRGFDETVFTKVCRTLVKLC